MNWYSNYVTCVRTCTRIEQHDSFEHTHLQVFVKGQKYWRFAVHTNGFTYDCCLLLRVYLLSLHIGYTMHVHIWAVLTERGPNIDTNCLVNNMHSWVHAQSACYSGFWVNMMNNFSKFKSPTTMLFSAILYRNSRTRWSWKSKCKIKKSNITWVYLSATRRQIFHVPPKSVLQVSWYMKNETYMSSTYSAVIFQSTTEYPPAL